MIQRSSEGRHAGDQGSRSPTTRKPEKCNPSVARRIVEQRVAELRIERDETPAIVAANLNEPLVIGSLQLLLRDGGDVMTGNSKRFAVTLADVLVELDLQESRTIGTSMYRSRLISAP